MDPKKLVEQFQKIAPYIAAAGTGSAIGGSVSDDRKKGAVKGALIGLGSLVGGRLAAKGGQLASNRILGKSTIANAAKLVEDIEIAKKMYPGVNLLPVRVVSDTVHKALVKNGFAEDAAKFAKNASDPVNFATAYNEISDAAKKSIKDIPVRYDKVLAKNNGIVQGAATIGSSAGLAGSAYALKNGNNTKK